MFFTWLFLFFSSSLSYGEVQSSSLYYQDSRTGPSSQGILSDKNSEYKNLQTTNILLARNQQAVTIERKVNRTKKKKQAKKSTIQPEYESCKNKDISSLALHNKSSSKNTEGRFCSTCFESNSFGVFKIQDTMKSLQTKPFKDKLQKRVIGQIESKLFQVEMHKACIKSNRKWFDDRKIDWPFMKGECVKLNKELKSSIQSRWSKMRVNLSLASPSILENRIFNNRATWFDSSPSHLISSFKDTSLPKLKAEEKKEAEKLYMDKLSKVSLKYFSDDEFKKILLQNRPFPGPYSRADKYITSQDQSKLRAAVKSLREEAKSSYFQSIEELPILVYLEKNPPEDEDLNQAFSKMEGKLADFLKEVKDPEVNMGLLLSFKPLVEEILKENENYCLVAEEARIKAEKDESLRNNLMMGVGVLSAIPCFVTGPVGASLCLAGGMGLGVLAYKAANVAREKAFGRALTGKQFESIAGLNKKEKEELLAKLFLPLNAWGATAVSAKAVSKLASGSERTSKALTKTVNQKKELKRFLSLEEDLKKLETKKIQRRVSGEELKIPKRTKEAERLKAQGFSSDFTNGIDEMNEMIAVSKQLRKMKVDPYTDHVDFFADKIKEQISFMEKGVKNSAQRKEMNLLKESVEKAIKEKTVTYEKWIKFNIISAKTLSEFHYKDSIHYKSFHPGDGIDHFIEKFPQKILMPTTNYKSGFITMNKGMDEHVHVLGLPNKITTFHDEAGDPYDFLHHDLGHAKGPFFFKSYDYSKFSNYEKMKKVRQKIQDLPPKKRREQELVYWYIIHEKKPFSRNQMAYEITESIHGENLTVSFAELYKSQRSRSLMQRLHRPVKGRKLNKKLNKELEQIKNDFLELYDSVD